ASPEGRREGRPDQGAGTHHREARRPTVLSGRYATEGLHDDSEVRGARSGETAGREAGAEDRRRMDKGKRPVAESAGREIIQWAGKHHPEKTRVRARR